MLSMLLRSRICLLGLAVGCAGGDNNNHPIASTDKSDSGDQTSVVLGIVNVTLSSAGSSVTSDKLVKANTAALQAALNKLNDNETLQIPAGVFEVETVDLPTLKKNITIQGAGIDKTIVRRSSFYCDNGSDPDHPVLCPVAQIFRGSGIKGGINFKSLTFDGNSHKIGIKGPGTFNADGKITSGSPQFPKFIKASGDSVIYIELSNNVLFDDVRVSNGYRWALHLGKVDGFIFQNGIIDTGNISSDFNGHFDPAPNNKVQHVHTSQDGIHMVNVSNVRISYNDIHSEDSSIAIENNPNWTSPSAYEFSENIVINNNNITGGTPTVSGKLMVDPARFGSGLASSYTGQGAVDIFYNENWDEKGQIRYAGSSGARIKNIKIQQNRISNLRYGVRSGIFLGAGSYNATHFHHRIQNLSIEDHVPGFEAGRAREKSGIYNIAKAETDSFNRNGGIGIKIFNTDVVSIKNNLIQNVKGGIGINLVNTSAFSVVGNTIDGISGTQVREGTDPLGEAGEALRIWNDSTLVDDPQTKNSRFIAQNSLIQGNKFGSTARPYRVSVYNTEWVRFRPIENFTTLPGETLCRIMLGQPAYNNSTWLIVNAWMDIGTCK